MQCPCGDTANLHQHEVKTIDKALEWYPDTQPSDLPIMVQYHKCSGCGRIRVLDIEKANH